MSFRPIRRWPLVLAVALTCFSPFALTGCDPSAKEPDTGEDPGFTDDPGHDNPGPDNPGTDPGEQGVIHVTSVSLDRTEIIMNIGWVDSVDCLIEPEDATDQAVTWESSDPSVVTVDDEGGFTATGAGEAVITVRTQDGGKTATCTITVRPRLFSEADYGGEGDDGKCRFKYGARTVVLSEETAELFQNVSKEGFQVFESDLGGSPIYSGDIFVFPRSETFPEGFAAKVTSSDATGGDEFKMWNIHTVTASLEDVFEELSFSTVDLDLAENVEKVLDEDGVEVPYQTTRAGTGFQLRLPTAFGISSNIQVGEGSYVTPDVVLGFKMNAECDLSWHKLKKFTTRIERTTKIDVDFAIKAEGTKNIFKSKKYSFMFGAFVVGPVTLHPVVTAKLNVDLTGEVALTTHLHYYLDEFLEAGYTEERGVYAECGEVPEQNPQSAITVSGSLGGGVSVGPDIGVGMSIWAGALQLTLDVKPRLNATFNCSIPFNAQTFVNLLEGATAAQALAQAYLEPSVSVSLGGSFDYGWTGSKPFKFPGNLSYSICKLYLIPSLEPEFNYTVVDNSVFFSSSCKKEKSLYNKNIFINLAYQDSEPEGSDNYITKRIKVPLALDEEKKLRGDVSGLPRGHYYTIEGPYIGVEAFNTEVDLKMFPVQNFERMFHIDNPADYPMEELRPILKDILNSVPDFKMYFPDCNWEDPGAVSFWNVYSSLSYGINEVCIQLPPTYLTKEWSISIGKHNPSFNWILETKGGTSTNNLHTLKNLTINDDHCCAVRFGMEKDGKLEVHSKALKEVSLYGSYPQDMDLSRSGMEELKFLCGIPGTVKLDNCSNLYRIEDHQILNGSGELVKPQSVSVSGAPLKYVRVDEVTKDEFSYLRGMSIDRLTIGLTAVGSLSHIPDIAKEVEISVAPAADYRSNEDATVTLSGLNKMGTASVRIPVGSLTVTGCPNLLNVGVTSECRSLNIPDTEYISLSISGSGPLPDWTSRYSTGKVILSYAHKYTYKYDYELVGPDSSDPDKNIYSRTYKGYDTAATGLYYPWEPGLGYHCNSRYYMENSSYPNDRSDRTNQ